VATDQAGTEATVSPAVARYLEAAFYIRGEGEPVRRARLAEWLGVSAPSVTQVVNRLIRDGLVAEGPGHSVELTDAGEHIAADIVRRHRIVEFWLVRTLGLDWVAADAEAQTLAHGISDLVLRRLHEAIGRPTACPHGNPIPGEHHPARPARRLAELAAGATGQVSRISEVTEHDAPAVLTTLYAAGLTPGTAVTVRTADRRGVEVEARGRTTTLPLGTAAAVWVCAA
jgi:DtxR family Mn-dependent transcriptional regulator